MLVERNANASLQAEYIAKDDLKSEREKYAETRVLYYYCLLWLAGIITLAGATFQSYECLTS